MPDKPAGYCRPFAYFGQMKKWVPVLIHVFAWSLLLSSSVWDFQKIRSPYMEHAIRASGLSRGWFGLIYNLSYLTDFLVAFYGAYFFVGPLLFIQKKYVRAMINLVLVLAAMVLVRWLGEFHLLLPYLRFDNYFGRPFQL